MNPTDGLWSIQNQVSTCKNSLLSGLIFFVRISESSKVCSRQKWPPIVHFVALRFGLISKNVKDVVLSSIAVVIARNKIGNITRTLVPSKIC